MTWPGRYRGQRGPARDKLFRDALRMELAAAGEDLKELREVARALIDQAKSGNVRAIEEIADRLDGKPVQQMPELPQFSNGQVHRKVTYEIIHTSEETLRAKQQLEAQQQLEAKEIEDVEYRAIEMIENGSGGNRGANGNGHERG